MSSFRYAKIEISASSPVVPFRETIVPPPTIDMVNESIQDQNPVGKNEKQREFEDDDEVLEAGLVRIFTPSKYCMVQIRAVPLPPEVTKFLDENQFLIKTLDQYMSAKISERHKAEVQLGSKLKQSTKDAIGEFKEKLETLFTEAGKQWKGCVDCIWAFGPRRVGPNLLLNKVDGYHRTSMWDCLRRDKTDSKVFVRDYDYSVVSGFQISTLTGPLCDEPMRGVCFIVEKWEIGPHLAKLGVEDIGSENEKNVKSECYLANSEKNVHIQLSEMSIAKSILNENDENIVQLEDNQFPQCSQTSAEGSKTERQPDELDDEVECVVEKDKRVDVKGHVSGQLISVVKEACLKAFQTQPQRLMAAMYKCNIQATTDVLGNEITFMNR